MKKLFVWLDKLLVKHKALKRWKRTVTVLAAIITFVTTYALILPAITVEKNQVEEVGGMYLEREEPDDLLVENALEPTGIQIAADQENAVTFSYVDEQMTATAIFSTDEKIPEESELVVNPVDPESEEYTDLSSRSAELLDREFIYDVITCSFYDYALVCDNVDVTPKTGLVDIQIVFHNNTVEHVDDMLFAGRFAKPASEEGGFVAMSASDSTIDADELISVNPDESSVIELTDDNIITAFTLKGNDLAYSDSIVGILAGYVDEELKAEAAETDAEIPDYDGSQDESGTVDSAENDGEKGVPTEKTLKATGSDYTVTLTYDVTSEIPEGASLTVSEIAQGSKEYKNYLEKTKKAMGLTEEETLPRFAARFFDIKIMVGGKEFTPESGVSVEITYTEPLAENPDTEVSAVHFANKKADAEMLEASTSEVQEDGTATAQFTAESFSVYGVIYTVDFHWEVNGKTYDFSIPGGGFTTLRQLAEKLGIADNETTKDFVADVASVEFSSPELVWVGKAEEETTVEEIKEDNGLECEYSADLSENQIEAINSSAVEAGDWVLIGMRPFASEESLTVTMSNGDQFVVKVTDAQYVGTAVSTLNGATGALINRTNNNAVLGIPHSQYPNSRLQAVGVSINGNQITTTDGSPDLTSWTFNYVGNWDGYDHYTIRCNDGYLNLSSESATISQTPQNLIVVTRQSNGLNQYRIANDAHDALNNTGNNTANGYSCYNNWGWAENPGEWFTVYSLTYPDDPFNLDGKTRSIINNRDGGSNWYALRDDVDNVKDARGYYMDGNRTSYTNANGVDYSAMRDVDWTFEFVRSDSTGSYYRIHTSNGYLYIDPDVTKKSDMPPNQTHNFEHALRIESSAGDGTSSDGTLIRIVANGDGTYLLQNRNGVCLWNYDNNQFWLSTLTQDNESDTSKLNSRFRLTQGLEEPHVTVHYVDREGHVLTGVQYTGSNEDVIDNHNGTFTIPYSTTGNVDLMSEFDFSDIGEEHVEYTYANTHLDGVDADNTHLEHKGYIIDSGLIARNGDLFFKSDTGETTNRYDGFGRLSVEQGNLKYDPLNEYSLSQGIKRRPATDGEIINYTLSGNQNIYVVLDPLPGSSAASPIEGTEIDAEAPDLNKTMTPNDGDGTYTLSLKVDAHARNDSETNRANVLFIVDTSSSMRAVTRDNKHNRIMDVQSAVSGLGSKLLDYNNTLHSDAVEVALLAFDGTVYERQDWTTSKLDFNNSVNEYLRYYYLHTGTDWEDALDEALIKLKEDTDDDPTFVIFLTDGEPSQYTNFSGSGTNSHADPTGTNQSGNQQVSGGYSDFFSYFLSREGAKDEMRAIVDTGASLYGIYAYNKPELEPTWNGPYEGYNGQESGAEMLHNALKYGYYTENSLSDNLFYDARDSDDVQEAFDKIYNLITEKVGFSNVVVEDGISTAVTSSTVVNGDVSGFTYIIRDKSGALAYKVTVAPNGVPAGETVADGTPIFTLSDGTVHVGRKKEVPTTKIITDENGVPILDASDKIQTETVNVEVYSYTDTNNKEYIMPIATPRQKISWDLSPLGMLKDGYSYEVNFVVWPNQEAYDLVADLNNGKRPDIEATAVWESKEILTDGSEREYRIGGFPGYPYIARYENPKVYSAMSNTNQSVDYYKIDKKIIQGQEVTEITGPVTKNVDPPDPMPLTATMSQIEKQWNVDRNPRVLTELLYGQFDPETKEWIPFSITFGVFIEDPVEESTGTDDPTDPDNPTDPDDPTDPDNPTDPDDPTDPDNPDNPTDPDDPTEPEEEEPYKSVTLGWNDAWDKNTHDYEWVDTPAENNVIYNDVGHKVGTRWAQDFSIATGLMLTEARMNALGLKKSSYDSFVFNNVTYYLLEEGHDYRLEESPKLSYDFDTPETRFHPMLVNGKLQSVTFSRDDDGNITGITGMTNEANGLSSLKIQNTLRGYIHLNKVVVGKDGSTRRPTDNTKFAYKITLSNPTPVFEGDHIPWYAINGLYYHDDDFNYYQAYLDDDKNLKICTEKGTLDHPYDAEIGCIDPDTEEFVPDGIFDENNVTGQVIRFNDGSGDRIVTIKGNQTEAAADMKFAQADMMIGQNETLSIANVPLGTEYSITETQTDGYRLVSVASNQSTNPKADIDIDEYEITGNIVQNADNNVTYTNKVIDGSLQITKNVTVDNRSAVGTDWENWADGEYFFTITDADGKPAVGKVGDNWIGEDGKVCVVITNGESNTITVTDLRIGEYTITEDKPNNGSTLVEFKVNGVSKTVENGVVSDDDDKKITVVENETTTTSFTNNINPTSVEVEKVWSDDIPTGASHSDKVIEYEIFRTPYVMVDDPENPGNKKEVPYDNQVKVDQTLVPTMRGYTGELRYIENSQMSWKENVSRIPKTGVIWDDDNEEYVYLTYKYTIKEKTIVEGYKTILTGGEVDDEEQPDEYSYIYTITNAPLGPLDQETHVDIQKQWKNADATSDTDPHMNDTVHFTLTQKKYNAKVKYVYNNVTYENIPLYPITIVVRDKLGLNGPDRITNEELSTIVYVPAGAEFRIKTTEANPDKVTNDAVHYVEGYGLVEGVTGHVRIEPGQTYTVPQVNSAMEITLDLHAGHDLWVADFDEDDEEVDYHYWKYRLSSPQGIIWHLEELQERVLDNISSATGAPPVPCEGYPVDYSYTIELTEDVHGVHTLIETVGNSLGHGGLTDAAWKGSVTNLPLYEYEENEEGGGGTSYIYTYEVSEALVNTDEVNTTDPPPIDLTSDPPKYWDGQTAYYLVMWKQNTDKTDPEYGLWTLTNQKKPPIDVTLYKVDKNNIPDSSTLLEGAEFKLVKKKLVRSGDEGNHHWVWSKDTDWGTEGESAVVSENSQNPGVFSFGNLDAGYYEIVETKRPKGYIQAVENPVFQVRYNKNSVAPEIILVYASGENIGQPVTGNATDLVAIENKAIVVGNQHGAALPHTGGLGTTLFYLIGILLTGIAGAGLLLRRRRTI